MIRTVDPFEFAPQASEILSAAWKPPTIRYSPEYLRWQLSFPSSLPPISLSTDEESGFVAAVGRRFTFKGTTVELYLSSFFSVRPGSDAAVSLGILRAEARALKASGEPMLVFAQPESVGEAMLAAFDAAGMKRRSLAEVAAHLVVSRGAPPATVVDQRSRLEAFASLAPSGSALLIDPEHYFLEPRGIIPAVAYRAGRAVACALMGWTESVTRTAEERTPTLYCLRATESEGISSLIASAGGMALVPNVTLLDPAIVKAAGLRRGRSAFRAYLFTPPEHSLDADGIEMEPV